MKPDKPFVKESMCVVLYTDLLLYYSLIPMNSNNENGRIILETSQFYLFAKYPIFQMKIFKKKKIQYIVKICMKNRNWRFMQNTNKLTIDEQNWRTVDELNIYWTFVYSQCVLIFFIMSRSSFTTILSTYSFLSWYGISYTQQTTILATNFVLPINNYTWMCGRLLAIFGIFRCKCVQMQ